MDCFNICFNIFRGWISINRFVIQALTAFLLLASLSVNALTIDVNQTIGSLSDNQFTVGLGSDVLEVSDPFNVVSFKDYDGVVVEEIISSKSMFARYIIDLDREGLRPGDSVQSVFLLDNSELLVFNIGVEPSIKSYVWGDTVLYEEDFPLNIDGTKVFTLKIKYFYISVVIYIFISVVIGVFMWRGAKKLLKK